MLKPLIIALLLAFYAVPASFAGVKVTEKTYTYRVSGSSIQAAVKTMTRRGPMTDHGRRAAGLADFRYRTSVKTKKSNGFCRVTDVTVTINIFYKIPKHSNPSKMSSRDRRRWRSVVSMIDRHERQHGRYYRQFATQLHNALRRMKPQRSCGKFRTIERGLRKKYEGYNKSRNRRYDRAQHKPFNKRLEQLAPGWR